MGTNLKTNFAAVTKYGAFYTTGKVQASQDGKHIFCCCGNKLNVVNIQTGQNDYVIGEEDDPDITSFIVSADEKFLVIALQNLVLKQWDWKQNSLMRSWKAIHSAPVLTMSFDCTVTLLATGSSDSTIKVWDVVRQYCTHNLRGHQGVITAVKFHPDISKLQLISAAEDYKIRVWDLQTSTCLTVLDKHYSVITSLDFLDNGSQLLSAGRDSVLISWDLTTYEAIKTIPVYEAVESVVLLPNSRPLPQLGLEEPGQYCMTAGSKGLLRVWNLSSGKCVYTQTTDVAVVKQSSSDEHDQAILQAFYVDELDVVTVVTYDHNILLYNLKDLSVFRQFSGYNDEILDIGFLGEDDSHIVVATNSELIKIFELSTWSCQIIHGHTDIVLCLNTLRKDNMFVTSSKDNTIRLWRFNPEINTAECVGVGLGHTSAVGSVVLSRLGPSFIVSGGQDYTVKLWTIPSTLNETTHLQAIATEKAHDKDINSIAVSPNDKLIATGSQDKIAKLWNASNLSLLGVMRGHKRGIWCVQFSPVDQCLATASADGIIKIWSLSDFTCVKTFEGHDASVLQVDFVSRGMQLLSSGSDGLMKLWTIKTNECVKTFDEHEDKAWALAVSKNEQHVITGGADSTIILWKDVTESEFEEEKAKEEDVILKEQELSNLLQQKKYLKALGLAITLDQPMRVLNIIKEISGDTDCKEKLAPTVEQLRMDQIDALLRFAVQWNMNSRHCHTAQLIVCVILKTYSPDELCQLPNIKTVVEALVPYTDRHFQRMNRLLQNSTFIGYTWQCMKLTERDTTTKAADSGNEVFGDNSKETETETVTRNENVETMETTEQANDEEMDVTEMNESVDNVLETAVKMDDDVNSSDRKTAKKKKKLEHLENTNLNTASKQMELSKDGSSRKSKRRKSSSK